MGFGSLKSHSTSVSTLPGKHGTLFTPSSRSKFGVRGFNGLLISHSVGWQDLYICVSINAAENGYVWTEYLRTAYNILHNIYIAYCDNILINSMLCGNSMQKFMFQTVVCYTRQKKSYHVACLIQQVTSRILQWVQKFESKFNWIYHSFVSLYQKNKNFCTPLYKRADFFFFNFLVNNNTLWNLFFK